MERKRLLRELRDILLLAGFGFALTWLKISGVFSVIVWIVLWKGNEYLGEWLSSKISWLKSPLRRFVVGAIVTVAYTLGAMYLLKFLYEFAFDVELRESMVATVVIAIGISLFMYGREFLINWKAAAQKAELLKKESIRARYESLKHQVNPHFLFNSLNALTNLVYDDEEKAITFIDELSRVYRYVLDTQEHEKVPVEDELRFLDSYLYLQKIRFGDKLRVSVRPGNGDCFVAPLALQMLVENAIKHNIISEDDPLSITVTVDERGIVVENNLQRKSSSADDSAGVGLENIRRRYAMLGSGEVDVRETEAAFRVTLPLMLN